MIAVSEYPDLTTLRKMAQRSSVLVVDDEPLGREVVRALLHGANYELRFADSGAEALAQAEALPPDLILLDVLMPGMNGYDVCRHIRNHPQLADVPVILLTALNDRDARIRGIEAGADDFISKPFDRAELSVRVRTILQLNRFRRLMAERAKFAWVVESADDGYVILDADDTIAYANPRARLLLGLPGDDDLPATPFLTLAQRQYRCHPQAVWDAWPQPPADSTLHLVRPQDSTAEMLWLQVDVMGNDAGDADSMLLRLRDITHEISQQQLRWSFHAQIQHKFRHPLAILNGLLEILHQAEPDDARERRQLVDGAFKASRYLSGEILSVLNYLTVSSATEAHSACSALTLLATFEAAGRQMTGVELHASTDIDQLDTRRLPLSAQQIENIAWELLNNAQKFHPQGAPRVEVRLSARHSSVVLRVCDDGRWLSPDKLMHLWTPYYQAERYYTGQVPGMGLGLAMIAAAVWGVGGQCQVANRSDHPGLLFEFTLPVITDQTDRG